MFRPYDLNEPVVPNPNPAGPAVDKVYAQDYATTKALAGKRPEPLSAKERVERGIRGVLESAKHLDLNENLTMPWQEDSKGHLFSTDAEKNEFRIKYLRSLLGLNPTKYGFFTTDADQELYRKGSIFDQDNEVEDDVQAGVCVAAADRLVELEMEKALRDKETEFKNALMDWIMGKRPAREYNRCWWVDFTKQEKTDGEPILEAFEGRKMIRSNPGITQGIIEEHGGLEFKKKVFLEQLQRTFPKTQEEAYLWYKYLVLERDITFDHVMDTHVTTDTVLKLLKFQSAPPKEEPKPVMVVGPPPQPPPKPEAPPKAEDEFANTPPLEDTAKVQGEVETDDEDLYEDEIITLLDMARYVHDGEGLDDSALLRKIANDNPNLNARQLFKRYEELAKQKAASVVAAKKKADQEERAKKREEESKKKVEEARLRSAERAKQRAEEDRLKEERTKAIVERARKEAEDTRKQLADVLKQSTDKLSNEETTRKFLQEHITKQVDSFNKEYAALKTEKEKLEHKVSHTEKLNADNEALKIQNQLNEVGISNLNTRLSGTIKKLQESEEKALSLSAMVMERDNTINKLSGDIKAHKEETHRLRLELQKGDKEREDLRANLVALEVDLAVKENHIQNLSSDLEEFRKAFVESRDKLVAMELERNQWYNKSAAQAKELQAKNAEFLKLKQQLDVSGVNQNIQKGVTEALRRRLREQEIQTAAANAKAQAANELMEYRLSPQSYMDISRQEKAGYEERAKEGYEERFREVVEHHGNEIREAIHNPQSHPDRLLEALEDTKRATKATQKDAAELVATTKTPLSALEQLAIDRAIESNLDGFSRQRFQLKAYTEKFSIDPELKALREQQGVKYDEDGNELDDDEEEESYEPTQDEQIYYNSMMTTGMTVNKLISRIADGKQRYDAFSGQELRAIAQLNLNMQQAISEYTMQERPVLDLFFDNSYEASDAGDKMTAIFMKIGEAVYDKERIDGMLSHGEPAIREEGKALEEQRKMFFQAFEKMKQMSYVVFAQQEQIDEMEDRQ